MSSGRHECLWFDDADGVEVLCACGARAVAVVDDESGDVVLAVLAAERFPLAATA